MDYDVMEARYLRDHVLWLRFRDGTAGQVDLEPQLSGKVFAPLRDLAHFRRFTIDPEFRTLAWPDDLDIAPEFLHDAARANPAPPPVTPDSDTRRHVLMTDADGTSRIVDVMPVISRFLGITISMYHREHGLPHFHAAYGGHRISVEVESGVVHGAFPPRALRLVREWATRHRSELLRNWDLAQAQKPLAPIPPLE